MTAITKLLFPKSKKGMQQFLGSLNYYSRFIQDFAVYGLYQLKEDDFSEGVADTPILRYFDTKKEVHIMMYANEWALSATLMQMHDDKLHPVRFCGRVLKDAEMNYHSAGKEVLALLLLLKSLFGRAVPFAVLLSPWQLEVQRVREKECVFTQLLQSTIANFVDLDDSLALVAPPTKELVAKLKSVRYLHVVREYNAATDSLAGEALESKVSKVVLNDHRKTEPKELNRIQEMIYEPSSDDIKIENASSETFAQILDGKTRYIHAMDSDILLQRKTFADFAHRERAKVSATTRSQSKTKKKRVHFEDEVPGGTTNTEVTEAANEDSETQGQRPSAEVRHELTADDIDPVTVQEERRRRVAKAQDEELRWLNLKAVLRGETTATTYKEAQEA
ncbi:hypothetical protein PHMEG_00017877, partial [Phytophthora megakarya]